jgi:hypothetical protein
MIGIQRFAAAIVLAAGYLALPGLATAAQTAKASAPAARQAAPQAAPDTSAQPPDEDQTGDRTQAASPPVPLFAVISVEVVRSTHPPVRDLVRVRGIASTGGWSDPELLPLTRGAPVSGVLDLVMVGQPPQFPAGPGGFDQFEVILPIEQDHPFTAIRVRGATNALTVRGLPGYAEAGAQPDACQNCIGKIFVAHGASAPAGVVPADTVSQDSLPANLRLLRPNDGVGNLEADPNRLTLIIDDDGRIVDASWD